MPRYPLHPNCHCIIEPISKIDLEAECDISKFRDYIFDVDKNKGKNALFESWGYDIIDSEWLQSEFVRQAQIKYSNGDFILKELSDYGQIIKYRDNFNQKG